MSSNDSMKELFVLVEEEIDSGNEYGAVEKLKTSGLEHEKACVFVETVMLHKVGYFSLFAKLKRSVTGKDRQNVKAVYQLICNHLIPSHYESAGDVDKKITASNETYMELESEHDYCDELYYYASEFKRKIIVLVNLHFGDLPNNLQEDAMNLIGKEKMARSIDQRAKYLHRKLQAFGEE